MAIRTTKNTKIKEPETIESQIARIVVDGEYKTGQQNIKNRINDFESAIDMLECERTEKNADWMSDIFIPEFPAQMLTQSSIEANQYFQTRDFVEVYLEDGTPESMVRADAAKELINRTLNQRELHYYQKFMRSNVTKNIGGEVFIQCGWERKTAIKNVPVTRAVESDYDEYGNFIVDRNIQTPMLQDVTVEEPQEVIVRDRFNFEIIDRRNIFMDNSYTYSLQDKKWIIMREEKTLNELIADTPFEEYINLGKLKEKKPDLETDTSKESYNKDDKDLKATLKGDEPFDVIHRYGKFWAIVNSKDRYGNPADIEYGIDVDGNPKDKAELVEAVISFAISGSTKQIIRFIPVRFIDAFGNPYRPLIRGICYIHPTKDWGLGDGKFCRELQVGINDTFNISNDRVMLATLPTLKGKKYAVEDNASVYFEPGHTIQLENPDDLVEFAIKDNIEGSLNQIGLLRQFMSGVTSIFPPSMGSVPELASTTATAVAGSEQAKSTRANYRALTFEHTFLTELYWMIIQMTYQFATEETAFKLMGKKVYDFDPTAGFTYKPLSQSIETEYSRANQIREITQLIGFVAPTSAINPKAPALVNYMISKVFKLFGDEYEDFSAFLLDENAPVTGQMPQNKAMPMSNQNMTPMSGMESNMRNMAGMR